MLKTNTVSSLSDPVFIKSTPHCVTLTMIFQPKVS